MKPIDSRKNTFNATMVMTLCFLVFTTLLFQGTALAGEVSPEAREFLNKMSNSLAEVAEVTKPSVVNISTTTLVSMKEHPMGDFFNDPFFRRFFGDGSDHP